MVCSIVFHSFSVQLSVSNIFCSTERVRSIDCLDADIVKSFIFLFLSLFLRYLSRTLLIYMSISRLLYKWFGRLVDLSIVLILYTLITLCACFIFLMREGYPKGHLFIYIIAKVDTTFCEVRVCL